MHEGRKPYFIQPSKTEVVFLPQVHERVGGSWKPFLLLRANKSAGEVGFTTRNKVRDRIQELVTREGVAIWPTMVGSSDGNSDYHGVFVGIHLSNTRITEVREKAQELLEKLHSASDDTSNWPEVHFFDQEAA